MPHPQEVNYLAGKEAPSSVLINFLWRLNYSEYGSPSPLANLQMFCIRAVRTRASSDHVTGSIHLIGSQGNHKCLFRFFFECLFFVCGLLPPIPHFTQPFGEPRNGARCVVCVCVYVCVSV